MKVRRGTAAVILMATGLLCVMTGQALAVPTPPGPVFYECRKLAKVEGSFQGRYSDARCSQEATPQEQATGRTNRYELEPGTGRGRPFTGVGGPAVLHAQTSLGDMRAECASSRQHGWMVAPNLELGVAVVWSRCRVLGTEVCTSPGAFEGRIRSVPLRGQLGDLEEPGMVGVQLESEADPGGLVAEFKCGRKGFFEGRVHGELISSQQGDIGVLSNEFETVDVASERLGEQEFEAHKYFPLINLLGWAGEVPAIEAGERAPHVLAGEFCGAFIKALIAKSCTPPTDLGLDQVTAIRGESLGIFTG